VVDEKECKGKDEGGELPFCKVNCVYSSWSEWCPCSQTCIPRNVHRFRPDPEDVRDEPNLMQIMEDDAGFGELPVRRRRMCKIKPEAYGGTCPQEYENIGTFYDKGDEPFIEQVEQCVLADAHCLDEKRNKHWGDHFKWPGLPYPGEDPKFIGYCPVDCEWQPPKSLIDCQVNLEREFNETDYRCYELMAFDGLKKDEQEAIMAEVKERMKNKEVYEYPEDNADPESLQKRLQQTCGSGGGGRSRRRRRGGSRKERSRACRKTKRIMKAFKEDLANIFLLTTKETIRNAKLPNLDGLYGGKACIREDGRATTKYLDADEEKKYYGTEEYTTEHGACDLQLCMVNDDPMQPVVEKNCVSMWTAWTKWGKCNKDCGDDGNRKRTRKCVCACDETKEETDCRPAYRSFTNETITNEDFAPCTPCPPDRASKWSTWGDWKSDKFGCSNEKGKMTTYTRKRQCIVGPARGKCPPGKSGKKEGWDEDSYQLPRPPCDSSNPESNLPVPDGSAEPSEPSVPSEPDEPSEPSAPSEPSEPPKPSEPSEPSEPSDPSEPYDPSKPSEKPSESSDRRHRHRH